MWLQVSQGCNFCHYTLEGIHINLSLGAPRGVVTHIVQKFGCLKGIVRASARSLLVENVSVLESTQARCRHKLPAHFYLVVVVRKCKSTSRVQAHTSEKF